MSLPEAWIEAGLLDVADSLDSQRVPVNRKERDRRPGSVPYYGATGQVGWIDQALFAEELCLLGEDGAPFLDHLKPKAYVIDGPSWVNNHAHVLRAIAGLTSNRFLKYALDHVDYSRFVNGTTRLKLTKNAMRTMMIPLPPVAEQRRIVAAIEEQFSRLDAATQSLRLAQAKLAAHRVSTLIGALPLLTDYPTRAVSEVMDGNIGGVWGGEASSGDIDVLVFRVTEFRRNGVLDPATAAVRSISLKQLASRELEPGDLLLEKSGGGPDQPVGRVAYVPTHQGPAVCSNFVQLLRVNPDVAESRYVFYWLTRRYVEGSAAAHQTASTNIRNLKTKDYLRLPIPLPPLEDQRAIATALDAVLTRAVAVERQIAEADRRSILLRHSILEQAFGGKLVPQDPTEEPASVLLERIAAERAAAPKPTRSRKKVSA